VSPTVDGYAGTLSSSIPIKSEALNKSIQPSPVHGSGMAAPSLVVAAWLIGAGLSAIRAAAAEVKRELLCLLARLRVDHDLAYRYPAVVAGVGAQALEAGVVRL